MKNQSSKDTDEMENEDNEDLFAELGGINLSECLHNFIWFIFHNLTKLKRYGRIIYDWALSNTPLDPMSTFKNVTMTNETHFSWFVYTPYKKCWMIFVKCCQTYNVVSLIVWGSSPYTIVTNTLCKYILLGGAFGKKQKKPARCAGCYTMEKHFR